MNPHFINLFYFCYVLHYVSAAPKHYRNLIDKLTEVCSNKESIYSVLKTELGKEEYGLLCNWFGLNDYAETQKEVDVARSIGMEPGKFKTIKNRIFRKLRNPMKRYQFNY